MGAAAPVPEIPAPGTGAHFREKGAGDVPGNWGFPKAPVAWGAPGALFRYRAGYPAQTRGPETRCERHRRAQMGRAILSAVHRIRISVGRSIDLSLVAGFPAPGPLSAVADFHGGAGGLRRFAFQETPIVRAASGSPLFTIGPMGGWEVFRNLIEIPPDVRDP